MTRKIYSIIALQLCLLPIALLAQKPNIIFILVDDMGYSDLGCYGGEIQTPNIDSIAENGIRFTQMYNTSKCFPSRAALLTGLYAQQCGMDKTYENGISSNAVTLGEVLKTAGYRTYASGKHHSIESLYDRGFDRYYGLLQGACNFWNPSGIARPGEPVPGNKKRKRPFIDDEKYMEPYMPEKGWYATDAFTDKALEYLDEPECKDNPFFLYLSYTAPHYPLHAWEHDIERYEGVYDSGYNAIMKKRHEKMIDIGLFDPDVITFKPISEKDWLKLAPEERQKEIKRMQIYAAMLDCVDQNIGRLKEKLKSQGKWDNTIIMFASDNGGCAGWTMAKVFSTDIEDFGKVASYETVGWKWATVQNTPLRFWKNYSHEGGINTPFIVSWPEKLKNTGGFYREPAHFIDIMKTLVELTGAEYPEEFNNNKITPMQGVSLVPAFEGKALSREEPLFWEWQDGRAIRVGDYKAVHRKKNWELFNMAVDRNEANDLSKQEPEKLATLIDLFNQWKKANSLIKGS